MTCAKLHSCSYTPLYARLVGMTYIGFTKLPDFPAPSLVVLPALLAPTVELAVQARTVSSLRKELKRVKSSGIVGTGCVAKYELSLSEPPSIAVA
jgi:hypothetical protein